MAVYKVIQDVEAEDKLLGPLTLKSFIYAAIAGVLAFINVRLLIAGGPLIIRLLVIIIFLFPMLLFGILASPLGRDQPTEVWLLSHVRFFLKPRLRVWDQSGLSHLVTITAPKRTQKDLTNGLSQNEVQSRLQALASTLDSRGWVVKNSSVSLGNNASYLDGSQGGDSDRLIGTSSLPRVAAVLDIHPADDILDEQNNSTAQHFNQLMQKADSQRKQNITDKLNATRQNTHDTVPAQDTRFLDNSKGSAGNTTFVGRAVVAPHSDIDEASRIDDSKVSAEAQQLLERQHKRATEIHNRSAGFKLKTPSPPKVVQPTVTATQAAAKLELAQSGNDLSVASIAHLANRAEQIQQISPSEVVISLH